jgi:hypothetical protein
MRKVGFALLVFVQHNVLLATSFNEAKRKMEKNSYIALTLMGSLLLGACMVRTVDSCPVRSEDFLMDSQIFLGPPEYARSWLH